MNKTILVTGGAGFIGNHLVRELVKIGAKVVILDNLFRSNIDVIKDLIDSKKIRFIEGDIRDFETCKRAVDGVDFVLHQAALPSVPRSIENPVLSNEINVTGTLNLLLASREAKIKKFIFASSSSVYGNNPNLPVQCTLQVYN